MKKEQVVWPGSVPGGGAGRRGEEEEHGEDLERRRAWGLVPGVLQELLLERSSSAARR